VDEDAEGEANDAPALPKRLRAKDNARKVNSEDA